MNKLKIAVPVLILVVGGVAAALLIRARDPVSTEPAPPPAPLVRVTTVQPTAHTIVVAAQGTVVPQTEAILAAQVAGELMTVSDDLVAGGFFRRGQVLAQLDRRDYALAVETAKAEIARVDLQLVQERAEARLAAEEWQDLGSGGEPDPLVLRAPQIAQLEAAGRAAEAQVARAELDLERTTVRAPYDGRVRSVQIGRGQFVSPGAPLATIHPTAYAEVRLPVLDSDLAFLDFALDGTPAGGVRAPAVELTAAFGGRPSHWSGRIVRSEGELDPRTRMINLIARVDDPYARKPAARDRPPLPVGLFVDAAITGRSLPAAFVLPRSALRLAPRGDARHVLVVDDQDRLRLRAVSVLRLAGDQAIIDSGLVAGERVVVSDLDVVTDGMAVRSVEDEAAGGGADEDADEDPGDAEVTG